MASNLKSPPALNENSVYEHWKKEIAIWQAFTKLSVEKQGPAIFLKSSGKVFNNMELPDRVLAYRVLKSANLSTENEKLARATIKELTYKICVNN